MVGYIGRFAPSPSGPLHFGSIITALGSYLQAKSNQGKWLVRIEDIDKPRNQPGAIDSILHTLELLGLNWDGEIIIQSKRNAIYMEVLNDLASRNLLYPCICPRSETKSKPYPGTCRNGISINSKPAAMRLRTTHEIIGFSDKVQGNFHQQLESDVGDFILHRADGLIAYHLAVVVDDEAQGITEIVRGSDLLDSTLRQIYLQNLLAYKTPDYVHLPIATDHKGQKISKQNHATEIQIKDGVQVLLKSLEFLGQQPDPVLNDATISEITSWAVNHWDLNKVPAQYSIQVDEYFSANSQRCS